MLTRRLGVAGTVQGVAFRVTVKKWADELKVTGYVRNTPDGGLEVVAQGSEEALAELIRRCYDGPRAARVDSIKQEEISSEPFLDFVIKRDE